MIDLSKIITDLKNNDESSLEKLFDYYYPRLYNFSKSFLKIEDEIDDILQEVFVKIWQNRKKIKDENTFNSFIYTITRNLLLNELRNRLNNQKIKDEIFKLSVTDELYLGQTDYNELKQRTDQIINELPPRQKEIFLLSRTEGLSHKEIAQKLNITTKTVEYHITQSTSFIKKKLRSLGLDPRG